MCTLYITWLKCHGTAAVYTIISYITIIYAEHTVASLKKIPQIANNLMSKSQIKQ